jgi:hypothetical protein
MTIEFDEKGKFFTDVITKATVPAIIQTSTQRIHGNIYVRPDQRVKDELDRDEKFLAVTAATVFSLDGQVLYRCNFIAVQRSQIVWVIPENETITQGESGEQ